MARIRLPAVGVFRPRTKGLNSARVDGTHKMARRKQAFSSPQHNPNRSPARVKYALVRPVSPGLADALSITPQPMSYGRAHHQHQQYVAVLESILGSDNVIHSPALSEYPDSCFVEDTMVAIGSGVVLNRLGHASRQGEVDSVVLPPHEHAKLEIVDMRADKLYPGALCDGGDVLFTGRHLFIGLSSRTNHNGMQVIRKAFPGVEIIGVAVTGALHLKSVVTHMDERTLIAWDDVGVDKLLDGEMQATSRGYDIVRVPDALAANVVSVNEHVLLQDVCCQDSREALEQAAVERGLQIHFVDTSELAKCDGALTCCSVLLAEAYT